MVALVAVGVLAVLPACSSKDAGPAPLDGPAPPADSEVSVAFGLPRDDDALEAAVTRASDPSSPGYLRLRTPAQVRRRFGASAGAVADARAALSKLGIRNLELDPTGSMLLGRVTARQAEQALDAPLVLQDQADGSQVVLPASDPQVPSALRGKVTEVVGLSGTIRPPAGTTLAAPAGTPDPGCDDADLAPDADVAEYLRAFGTGPLYASGHDGAGVTIALLANERYDQAPIDAFEACRESPTVTPEVVTVPGTPPMGTGDEVTLDVLMAGWTAPGADLLVVQFDGYASPVFALAQVLASSASRAHPVDLLSTSITFCEAALPEPELALSEHLLQALALEGVSTLSAAGDHGVAGCYPDPKTPLPAYPSSSPYVTAVGGTEFVERDGRIVDEEAWREPDRSAAGGGGSSEQFPRPAYQDEADVPDGRRAYPDIASFAAVNRLNSIPRCDALSCRWVALGGTSAPAPTLAANLALVLDASRSAGGPERLGLLNPLLGSLSDASPPVLRDVVRGSTEMGGNRCCRAKAGWDMATGWGSIARYDRLAKQVAKLPADR